LKEDKEAMLKEIADRYNSQLDPIFAAARLWIDDIVDPANTRQIISRCISIASNNPQIPKFNPGVIQV